MESNLDEEVQSIENINPYIVVLCGEGSIEVYLVAELEILQQLSSSSNLFLQLIAAYFAFDMVYPKVLFAVLIFLQHFVLDLKDKQVIPVSVTKLVSSLDRIPI